MIEEPRWTAWKVFLESIGDFRYGGVGRTALREEQDGLQSIQLEHRLGRTLDSFFNARIQPSGKDTKRISLDDYYTQGTGFVLPAGYRFLGFYTRRMYRYPLLSIATALPNYDDIIAGGAIWIGFEVGAPSGTGEAAFQQGHEASGLEGDRNAKHSFVTLPGDYDTAIHWYAVKINRPNYELFVDGVLKAVILRKLSEPLPDDWYKTPPTFGVDPYSLGYSSAFGMASGDWFTGFIEIDNVGQGLTLPLDLINGAFEIADGDPLPPRQYSVYTENTSDKWRALATSGVTMTSHPIPVWGYPVKTLYFQANDTGDLTIQAYVGGGWRNYDPVTFPHTVVANQLFIYTITGRMPLIRYLYEPTDEDTITLGEVCIS